MKTIQTLLITAIIAVSSIGPAQDEADSEKNKASEKTEKQTAVEKNSAFTSASAKVQQQLKDPTFTIAVKARPW